MAAKIREISKQGKTSNQNTNPTLRADMSITVYPQGGTSLCLLPAGVKDPGKAIFNKGPRNVALIFGVDGDGDFVLSTMLSFLMGTPYYDEALANLKALAKSLPKG